MDNPITQSNESTSYAIYILAILILCVIVFNLYIWSNLRIEKEEHVEQTENKEHAVSKEITHIEPVHTPSSWCFVGEDLSGRYCVKVPSEESCDPDRTFRTHSDCAIINATHMPAGIIRGDGQLQPLQSMKFHDSVKGK